MSPEGLAASPEQFALDRACDGSCGPACHEEAEHPVAALPAVRSFPKYVAPAQL